MTIWIFPLICCLFPLIFIFFLWVVFGLYFIWLCFLFSINLIYFFCISDYPRNYDCLLDWQFSSFLSFLLSSIYPSFLPSTLPSSFPTPLPPSLPSFLFACLFETVSLVAQAALNLCITENSYSPDPPACTSHVEVIDVCQHTEQRGCCEICCWFRWLSAGH